ncbi:MAG: hypothetical protein EPO22_10365 [Dehalococcoidia bacterium]|nr:MAG: hypothetical protein EPO22_10365 [Dehalococcoidia bacterium]
MGLRSWPRAYRAAAALIRRDGFEMVHVLDRRLAPVGAMLRRRRAVPATLTLTAEALRRRGPRAALERRSFAVFDEAFVSDDAMPAIDDRATIGVPIYAMPSAARELPMPSPRDVARVLGALRGLEPEQPLVGVPWPNNVADFRWFRDIVMPNLGAKPSFLLFGVASRRELRMLMGVAGARVDVRAVAGPITAGLIAAAARMVDVFAVPAPTRSPAAPRGELLMALTVSGVPVVTDAASFDCVPAHETSGLMIDPGDERGFVAALDGVLRLPPVQRHLLGEEVARSTLREWPLRPVTEAYAARFASLLGRPVIPQELRVA